MVRLASPLLPQVKGMPETELKVNSSGFFIVDDETIISHNEDGRVLSRYGDDMWKFVSNKENLLLHFSIDDEGVDEAKKQQIKSNLKSLQFATLHSPSYRRALFKTGFNRQRVINHALRAVIEIALEHDLDFKQFFTGIHNHYLEEVLTLRIFEGLKYVIQNQTLLISHDFLVLERMLPVKKSFEEYVSYRYKELNLDHKQTLPIPERIYLMALDQIEQDLYDIDEVLLKDLISELMKNSENPLYGETRRQQLKVFRSTDKYQVLLKKNGCTSLPRNYDFGIPDQNIQSLQSLFKRLDNNLSNQSISGLFEYLTEIQKKCFRALVAYSGGRLSDIAYLKPDALQVHEVSNSSFPLLFGEVKKGVFTDDDVEFWVTNEAGQRAFNIAKTISNFIYTTAVNKKYQGLPDEERLLFASHCYSRIKGKRHGTLQVSKAFSGLEIKNAVLIEDDRIELMRLDPSLDLEREDIAEGCTWKFKTHQFRRSLALYAMASGAVSLPSLRRQLRHLGEAMALYYSDGSFAASNIIDKTNSFAKECLETKTASTAIALHKFVVSDEKIFGGMGRHLDMNQNFKNIILDQDITETKKMVERGELSFYETALGGCGETGNCDHRPFALTDTFHCCKCEKAYHKTSVMNKTIKVFEISLEDIPRNTRQYKWRELQIQELKEVRDSHFAQQKERLSD